jgi:hypothetical protein
MAKVKSIIAEVAKQREDGVRVNWKLFNKEHEEVLSGTKYFDAKDGKRFVIAQLGRPVEASYVCVEVIDLDSAGPLTIEVLNEKGNIIATLGPFKNTPGVNIKQEMEVELKQGTPIWIWIAAGTIALVGAVALLKRK